MSRRIIIDECGRSDGNRYVSSFGKQPKRGMVSCEKGYIEVMEYPRAWEAKINLYRQRKTELIKAGENADALAYELAGYGKSNKR